MYVHTLCMRRKTARTLAVPGCDRCMDQNRRSRYHSGSMTSIESTDENKIVKNTEKVEKNIENIEIFQKKKY